MLPSPSLTQPILYYVIIKLLIPLILAVSLIATFSPGLPNLMITDNVIIAVIPMGSKGIRVSVKSVTNLF